MECLHISIHLANAKAWDCAEAQGGRDTSICRVAGHYEALPITHSQSCGLAILKRHALSIAAARDKGLPLTSAATRRRRRTGPDPIPVRSRIHPDHGAVSGMQAETALRGQ